MTARRTTFGILMMTIATVCFAVGWTGIKIAGARLPTAEIIFFRSLAGLFILIPLTKIRTGTLKGNNIKLLIVRGIVGFIAMMFAFYAMIKMNLGDASMLLNTFPLFVALFAPFFLKEPSNPRTFLLAIVAFIGIALILKPTRDIINGTAFAGLAAGITVAFAMIAIRKLHETDNTWTIATWFTIIITLGSAPFLFFDFVMPTPKEWLIVVLTGFILSFSQLFLTKAYRCAKASIIAPFAYLSVIWSYLAEILVWGHMPDIWSVIGSAIIIGSGIGIIIISRKPVVRAGATS